MIDINRTTTDAHYRYKMPRLTISHEGKQKTVLENLDQISKSLSRNPNHIHKYISYELSVSASLDNGRYVLCGIHGQARLQTLIFDFIDLYVLCEKCENPETFYVMDDVLRRECLACGHKTRTLGDKMVHIISRDITAPSHMYGTFKEEESESVSSEKIYNQLVSEGKPAEDIISAVLGADPNSLHICKDVVCSVSVKRILTCIEAFIEKNKLHDKFQEYMRCLEGFGIKRDDLFKFFNKNKNKKSTEMRNEINKYFC